MLVVPEKVVLNANGDWNASVENLTYTVVGKKVETTNYQPTGITPAEGEVTSLKSFVLQFQKETFAVTNVDSQEEAYLINKDTQEKVSATLDMGDEYNEIKIELTEEVTAKGSYTLVVPAMKIQQASDSWGNNCLLYTSTRKRPIVNQYREGKVKSTPCRGVKEFLKPYAYKRSEHLE